MAWTYVILAGLIEIAWAVAMKQSEGFTRLWPSVFVVVGGLISIWFLTLAMRELPASTAYAVWTGIGAAGAAIYGLIKLGEPATPARLLCITLVVVGIIGLQLTSKAQH